MEAPQTDLLLRPGGAGLELVPRAEITSRHVRQFDAWWHARRQGRPCPARDEIDPTEFKELLPFFMLVDITYQPFDVRYRLCGTQIAQFDEELTGQRLDDVKHTSPADIALIKRSYQMVCATATPIYLRGRTTSPLTIAPIMVEGGIWPLSSDGVVIDKCAAIQDMEPFPSREGSGR